MIYDKNIKEEELKNKIAKNYFSNYDTTKIVGNVDFCVSVKHSGTALFETQNLLWAEAKKGVSDIYKSIVQLILTIGKARTFDYYLPPQMLASFDAEKIAFIPYDSIQSIFYINDFNWNVAPSDHKTKEFELVFNRVKNILDQKTLIFNFSEDDDELRNFIKNNLVEDKQETVKTRIDKNNFIVIYSKWLQTVKPTIAVNWDLAKKKGIISGDFYLADILSLDNFTLKEKLFVLLKKDKYELDRKIDELGMFNSKTVAFTDGQKAHNQFWNRYERPPKEQYWDYIVERRDLLVPQDVRERKGSFFTPQIWVELSQKYLTDTLGENWQDEYYIWDCAAGTGNLLNGLTNKYHIWASTLDKQDVEVMRDRIKNGANMLDDHVFQFDFLNDDFSKLPQNLQAVINDPKERKKLVIYINPPYAEAGNTKQRAGTGKNKALTTAQNKTYEKYKSEIGKATNELFTQFLIRIYKEIPNCLIAQFSKIKHLQSFNFAEFRKEFRPKLLKMFLIPANTFDNVNGKFPIGFHIWDGNQEEEFEQISADVYEKDGKPLEQKKVFNPDNFSTLSSFGRLENVISEYEIGHFAARGNDFQNQNAVFIDNIAESYKGGGVHIIISELNLIPVAISFAVRHCIKATWLNDRDQFLHPKNDWQTDKEFQNNCLAFTLFHNQNRISSELGKNCWIPFSETEINARQKFESNFMSRFIAGKINTKIKNQDIFTVSEPVASYISPLKFSDEAKQVFEAGRELWKYYHAQPNSNPNASLYDIRSHFQGKNANGRMNSKSNDKTYLQLMAELQKKLTILAKLIEHKVYKYEFLKK